MARVKESMEEQGLNLSTSFVFYGGHSLGGAMMPEYVLKHALDEVRNILQLCMAPTVVEFYLFIFFPMFLFFLNARHKV
jgi:hypothetical protein